MDLEQDRNYIYNLWMIKPRQAKRVLREERLELYKVVSVLSGKNLSEKAWKWYYNSNGAFCEECKKQVGFLDFRRGYPRFCSTKCIANNKTVSSKKADTTFKKHKVTHFSKTAEYKAKFKKTLNMKHGVDNPGQITANLEKRAKKKRETFFFKLIDEIKEFTTPKFTIDDYQGVHEPHVWECNLCHSDFSTNVIKIPKCPVCFPAGNNGGQSLLEKDILFEIKKFYNGDIIENDRTIIGPKEIDLYFPEFNFAIEANGVYWHSDKFTGKNDHQLKYNLCKNANIKLLMISDYEWHNKKDLVLNMIKHRLHICERKIFARKCVIQPICPKLSKQFLNSNHINGFSPASEHLGLFYDSTLVSVLTFMTTNRFKKNTNDIEIIRLAFNTVVIGAMGKFMQYILKKYPNRKIITYADLRYGSGEVYVKNKFVLTHTTSPGYWYFINNQQYHRLSWTKKKLVKMGYDKSKTEREIMDEMRAHRVYDCGHNYYEFIQE